MNYMKAIVSPIFFSVYQYFDEFNYIRLFFNVSKRFQYKILHFVSLGDSGLSFTNF